MSESEFYSVKQVSKIIGVTTRTVLTYIGDGKLNAVRINKRVIRIAKSDLQSFIENNNNTEGLNHE